MGPNSCLESTCLVPEAMPSEALKIIGHYSITQTRKPKGRLLSSRNSND